jgi:hypothetical protein
MLQCTPVTVTGASELPVGNVNVMGLDSECNPAIQHLMGLKGECFDRSQPCTSRGQVEAAAVRAYLGRWY